MNTKRIAVFGLLLVLAAGGYLVMNQNSSQIPPKTETTVMEKKDETVMEKNDEKAMEKPDAMMQKTGSYTDYSKEAFEKAQGKKRVYFFHASWCPTCKAANQIFTSMGDKIPADVVLFKTDYDTETALKTQYGITYQHTFVLVDETGKEVKKWNGGDIDLLTANTN